jgi:hypothetical protein
MRNRGWTTCLAVVALAAGPGVASASAATINFDVPVTGIVENTCTGDMVAIDGTMHVKQTDNSSLSGLKSQIETNLTGVRGTAVSGPLTGARYVMNDQTSDMQHAEFDPFGNVQATTENTTILTRLGEGGALVTGDDFRLHVLLHLTVSNGVTRSSKTDLRSECR